MRKAIIVIFFCQSILFSISGCSSGSKSAQEKCINCDIDFSIITGTGGGFTGLYDGYFIDSLINVYKWKGKTFETAEKVLIGKLSEEQTKLINEGIKASNILNAEMKEHGNISSYVLLENKERKHSISWSGIEPGDKVPDGVRIFYFKLIKMLDSLQKIK